MITRFAPSNTGGGLHLGNTRTALVSYVLAKKTKGEFVLRIEDTDIARSHEEHTRNIFESLEWLGVKADRPVTYQTMAQESGTYLDIANSLLSKGFAYYCNCSVESLKQMKLHQTLTKARLGYNGTCQKANNTSGVLRLNVKAIAEHFGIPRIPIVDVVLGNRFEDHRNLPDPVLLRADGSVGYLLANTVDDTLSGVNLISRGSDLYPQTALQILLRRAIDGSTTTYAHLPLMYNEFGNKLSKRSPDTKGILQYKAEGYLPDAIIQFALSLGNQSIPTDRALSFAEIIEVYDLSATSNKATSFVEHKIRHLNKLHIRAMDNEKLSAILKDDYGMLVSTTLVEVFKYRASTLVELAESIGFTVGMLKDHMDDLRKLAIDNFSGIECKLFRESVLGGRKTPPLNVLLELVA